MAGLTTRIQTRTDFTMLATNFAGGKSMTVIVARRIPVDRWREGILVARVHAVVPYNAGASLVVQAQPDTYTDEDPSIQWKVPSSLGVSETWTQGSDSVPQAKLVALVAPFGPMLLIGWTFTMATTPVDTTYSVSIDLNLKGQ